MFSQELTDRFNSRKRASPDGCILWTAGKSSNGYGTLYANGEFQHVHRLAWQMIHGPIPKGMVICHRCDVKLCVNPDHLFLGTRADNNKDARDKGISKWAHGEAHSRAKLSAADVANLRKSTASISSLARHYGVDRKTIRSARDGTNWKSLG
jgi:hypothetical protein